MMEVEYELTPEDVSAFHAYSRRHPSAPRHRLDPMTGLIMWIMCVLFSLACFAAFAFQISLIVVPMLIVAWVSGWTAVVAYEWYLKWRAPRAIRKWLQGGRDAEKVLGWARVILDAKGIHVTSQFSSCLYLWNGIEKIATTDEHLFLYLTTGSAQVVPLRAFADGRAFDAFADAAKRYHGMAGVGEGEAWKRRGATGIQAPDSSGKLGTLEGIVPKGTAP
jgi:YcxB-like protein